MITMMNKKKFEIMPAAILILAAIVLAGCSKNPESEVVGTNNTNQVSTASNNNANQALTALDTNISQTSADLSNNNISGNPAQTSTAVANNSSPPIVNKDKKSSPAVKEPAPQIGSGGSDLSLFTQARSALSSDAELLKAVIIEIKEGNATLTGSVLSAAKKAKAGQLVQSVKGIKSVKNNLRVAS